MAAKGSTSKRRYDAKHSTQPPSTVFFIDRCLGCFDVPNALRQAGFSVEIHKDHFNSDAPDPLWLPEVGRRGWVVLTKDGQFRSRQIEIAALINSGAPAFVLASRNTTGPQNGKAILTAMPQVLRLIKKMPPPFIAKITAAGAVELVLTQSRIIKLVD